MLIIKRKNKTFQWRLETKYIDPKSLLNFIFFLNLILYNVVKHKPIYRWRRAVSNTMNSQLAKVSQIEFDSPKPKELDRVSQI